MGPGETIGLISIVLLFIGLPWLILHYVTSWKKGGGSLTREDEQLLDELHEAARRLDDRLATIERIMTAENPAWRQVAADPAGIGIEDRDIRGTRRIEQ